MNILRVTVVAEIAVPDSDLGPAYEAKTIEEAAINQMEWYEDGMCGIDDLISGNVIDLKIEGIRK